MSPLSRLLSDHLGPSLWRWMETALAPVADWLTWKDFSMTVLFSLWCCNLVYASTGYVLESTGRQFGRQVVPVTAAVIAFPFLFWGGLMLAHADKSWAWNDRVFGGDATAIVIELSPEEWEEIMNSDPCGLLAEP